jgi:DNA-binding NtrC family response regulator
MRIDATERMVPVRSEPSLDQLLEGFLHGAAGRSEGAAPKLREWVELAEAWCISHALRQCRGNRTAAARLLGIGRRTLYTKMEKLGITPSFSVAGAKEIAQAHPPGALFP